ncbi:MAG: hypothetical protein V7K15_29325 [Nostoc sp.]
MPSAAVLLAEDKLRGASRREVACRTTWWKQATRSVSYRSAGYAGADLNPLIVAG